MKRRFDELNIEEKDRDDTIVIRIVISITPDEVMKDYLGNFISSI